MKAAIVGFGNQQEYRQTGLLSPLAAGLNGTVIKHGFHPNLLVM
jgi:hypothetical protein